MTQIDNTLKDSGVGSHIKSAEKSNAKRILIIDDNADAAESLRIWLELIGHHVTTAYDASSGLTEAKNGDPDHIIIDICLPDKNGDELAEEICRLTNAKPTFIALSCYSTTNDPQPPFDYFFSKPMTAKKLATIGLLTTTSS
jgi:CheY-like chemotaxis protein